MAIVAPRLHAASHSDGAARQEPPFGGGLVPGERESESGYGPTHDVMADWCRRHDPRRALQYESCGGGRATDIICPMYYADFLVAKTDQLKGQVKG